MGAQFRHGPKSEWREQAEHIINGDVSTSANDIPMMIDWLKDMNWPGADLMADYLRRLGSQTLEGVRGALVSGDDVWAHWVLLELGDAFDRDYWISLSGELGRLASSSDEEGAHIEALYLLAKNAVLPPDSIRAQLATHKKANVLSAEDYAKVEAALESQ